uniref:Uncharacterized protein n=1 Tax=Setaria viridis TaxID=4556 RepID=A0A4U6U5Q2_SETVI|nr:hypothetical protein SEVIR_6G063700v2 [Setaria viridis]
MGQEQHEAAVRRRISCWMRRRRVGGRKRQRGSGRARRERLELARAQRSSSGAGPVLGGAAATAGSTICWLCPGVLMALWLPPPTGAKASPAASSSIGMVGCSPWTCIP